MAIFEVIEGPPGQGKSLSFAIKAETLLRRNKRWFKRTGKIREIHSNVKFSEKFEQEAGEYLKYWTDINDVCKIRDADLLWDEIATEIDARNWANLSVEVKRFLSQYRKRGVDIFANTQDFSMIDARARLMITKVTTLKKLIGSRDISNTKPDPKRIWGIVMERQVLNYKETDPEKKQYDFIPSFFLIERKYTDMYNTTQDIPAGAPAPLKHHTVYCEKHTKFGGDGSCTFCQVRHT